MSVAAALVSAAATLVVFPARPALAADPTPVSDPTTKVDTLIGTGDSPTGGVTAINNFPGATVPFGMVQYSPDSKGKGEGYSYNNPDTSGFSMTHASVGCSAFGDVRMLPTTNAIGSTPWANTERIAHDSSEVGQPGYYTVSFPNTGVKAELTASTRVGVGRFSYPKDGRAARLIINSGGSLGGRFGASVTISADGRSATGTVNTGDFCFKGNRHTLYFAMSFDQAATAVGAWSGNTVSNDVRTGSGAQSGAWVQFASGTTLNVRTALSYVSIDGAKANLAAEATGGFDKTRSDANAAWKSALQRIYVASRDDNDLKTFYTALYHSLVHPNVFDDADGRYIGFDQKIYTLASGRHQYANFSDWDTYRSLAPLQAILFPDIASDQADSLVRDAQQSGSFPRWPVANAASGQMTGDSVPPLIANFHAYGATNFNTTDALKYMRNSAETGGQGLGTYVERRGAAIYNQLHYAPQVADFKADHAIAGASITLEWSIDDFAIGRFAAALGQTATASTYQQRSGWWQNLFNPSNGGIISPRRFDGRFPDALTGEDGFDEGNAAQYLWLVPHDTAGLISALGGARAAEARLDALATQLNAGSGQPYLWMGNEPDFGVPWIYNWTGTPTKTQDLVDRIRTSLFGPTPQGEPGNDDLGAQSSWYVWAALGLYPTTPGVASLAINTPIFDEATIALPGGKTLVLTAPGASGTSRLKHIAGVKLNGTASNSTAVPESLIRNGGTVAFTLTNDAAPTWGTAASSAPPSFPAGGTTIAGNTFPSLVQLAPGGSTISTLDLRRLSGSVSTVSISVSAPSSVRTSLPSSATLDANGNANVQFTVSHDGSNAGSDYPLTITVTGGGATRVINLLARVRAPGGIGDLYDVVGAAPEANFGIADFDGNGASYSREQLAGYNLSPGAAFAVGDLTGTWPASAAGYSDSASARGQTFLVPGAPHRLRLVGAGKNNPSPGTATVGYDDGTSAQFTVYLPDWVVAPGTLTNGTLKIVTMSHRNTNGNSVDGGIVYATGELTAPSGRKITSVTLPAEGNDPKTRVFALVSNASPSSLANAMTIVGTAPEANAAAGNFDRAGSSYSREQLAQKGLTPGARFTVSGLTATWPSASAGAPDAVQPSGQTVTVSGQPTRLRLVGSSRDGGSTGSVGVIYDNGAQSWFTVGLPDWVLPSSTNPLPDGAVQVAMMSSRNKGNGNAGAYVFGTSEIVAPSGRTIKSIILPLQSQMRIFAIASNATQ